MNMKGKQFLEKDSYLDPFRGPGRILWVCASGVLASNLWHALQEPAGIRMGYPGMALMGSQFDRIMLDDIYALLEGKPKKEQKILRARIDLWVNESLKCRLSRGGELVMMVGVKI